MSRSNEWRTRAGWLVDQMIKLEGANARLADIADDQKRLAERNRHRAEAVEQVLQEVEEDREQGQALLAQAIKEKEALAERIASMADHPSQGGQGGRGPVRVEPTGTVIARIRASFNTMLRQSITMGIEAIGQSVCIPQYAVNEFRLVLDEEQTRRWPSLPYDTAIEPDSDESRWIVTLLENVVKAQDVKPGEFADHLLGVAQEADRMLTLYSDNEVRVTGDPEADRAIRSQAVELADAVRQASKMLPDQVREKMRFGARAGE